MGQAFDDVIDHRSIANRKALQKQFESAKPFPHLVFHGLFKADFLNRILDDFGEPDFGDWLRWDNTTEVKRATRPGARLGPASRSYFDFVHRGPFVQFLSEVTGIEGLLPDPLLFGGGLHEIPDGGHFGVHVDFNKHPLTGLDNRLVMITYLNRGWQPSYGGLLELWDQQKDACMEQIIPLFGDTILFAHSSKSLHGHPVPVRSPDRRPRRSIAAYFYSNGRPDEVGDERFHSTRIKKPVILGPWARAATTARYFLPPVLTDGLRRIRGPR